MRSLGGRPPGWTRRWRLIAALAVLGAVLGALFAAGGPPRYESEASIVVTRDRTAADPVEMRRLAELATGSQVAEEVAALLGGDLAGADLLTAVTVSPAPEGGALVLRATGDSPDFSAAVADAYATAIPEVLGGPLEAGAEATSAVAVGGRSLLLWSLVGLLAGALVGAGFALALSTGLIALEPASLRRRPSPRQEQPSGASTPAEALPGAAEIVDFDAAGAVRLSLAAKGVVADLVEGSGPWHQGHRTLAVLAAEREDASGAAATALAVAAAGRGMHVLVVDGRLREPSVAAVLRVESEPGLAEYLSGIAGPRKVLRRVPIVDQERQPNQLACLPAGEGESGAGIAGGRFTELLERVARVYDLVVVAGPSLAGEGGEARGLARLADGTIVVCGVESERRAAAERAASGLRGATLHRIVGMERP